ncbi:MAG TPA: cbb3-type cytochrome c oxidase subunit 3 [Pelagibacterium sp.]|uniref:cbb3-type cytochrome oxidase subunit 3 n=1 Tax=Pelagibacterium sp. TaxID=1967288 RepID=UPI002CE257BC|nr:cbb3-type cytochrome c oxidase subunit 3 [Pelagibacterium sp.]HWJ88261.1 cbb3-type cytochrome c oxidase subunit 3 [Pelagibacterium sp.]
MMLPDHETLVAIAKSFGLFYLIAMSIAVLAYAYWPSNKGRFQEARNAPLQDGDDRP